ncbi:MAG: LysM peptidoglycan-binding domain-containing protein [Caulobacteraceae bacterium]|nr:LysM peptidoglycan-binding domain-containing protein [Caulobacteraceae bacterium]
MPPSQPPPVPLAPGAALYTVVLLAAIALALSLLFDASTPSPTPTPAPAAPAPAALSSKLPATQPGLGRDEGVFLFTATDSGSQAIYFIAGGVRHSILVPDMQLELQLNPLWPLRSVSRDEVQTFPEGAPVGAAPAGLLNSAQPPAPSTDEQPQTQSETAELPAIVVLHPGDNLTRIAAQYGTSVDAILVANGLPNANRIYAGQSLVIPSAEAATPDEVASAPVADDQTDQSDQPQAAAANAPAASDDPSTYTVQPGDSAIKIARRFGIDEGALLDANAISNPNRVYVGQVLTIPS